MENESSHEHNLESEGELIKARKDKIISFLKTKYSWISYIILAIIVFISIRIRTRNLQGLRDVTTGQWTLGPDLDPFLFTRLAEHIAENGSLMAIDTLRYVPLGFDTKIELILHPYLIAWFHKIAAIFGSETVMQSAAIFPVFFFAITVIAFFLMARKIFFDKLGASKANAIALIASFFLSVLPVILPRTIAGIPEKESSGFFFLFLSFYLFLSAWKSKGKYGKYAFAVAAGVSTAAMALVWGGFVYIFVTLGFSVFLAFLLGKVDKKEFYIYSIWLISSVFVMVAAPSRYTVGNTLTSLTTGLSVAVFVILLVHLVIFNTKIRNIYTNSKYLSKLSKPVFSMAVAIVVVIISSSIIWGPEFIFDKADSVVSTLVKPTTSRLGVTVAENRQPYFGEWSNSFGPQIKGVPIFFWLFVIGSIYLFNNMIKVFRNKERFLIVLGYIVFLVAIIFSRYRADHVLNGENFASIAFYFLGIIIFFGILGFYYYKYYNKGEIGKLKSIDFGMLLLLLFFIFGIISARGAVRVIMMLVPSTSIIIGYFVVFSSSKVLKAEDSAKKVFGWLIVGVLTIAIIFSGYQFYLSSNATAENFVPSPYNQQWQRAMAWARDNTSENAVFGHWWDYGYWIQSIGKRATILDGGNSQAYWNHLMGRYALTGDDEKDALEFLYSHDTTHFLIDSTDIGKYTAFSSIGSDEDYDRRSWINTFIRDDNQIFETKNSTAYIYTGGTALDEDITYGEIFLPGVGDRDLASSNVAGLGAVRFEINDENDILQPVGIFVYQGGQTNLPFRYAHYNNELIDFGSGIEAGIFVMPRIVQGSDGSVQVVENGALFYLSGRVVKSQLARLYLYGEESDSFKLAHKSDDFVISTLKSQGLDIGDFAHFQGFRGPIKIWEINYPSDIEFNEEFLETAYPEALRIVDG